MNPSINSYSTKKLSENDKHDQSTKISKMKYRININYSICQSESDNQTPAFVNGKIFADFKM